MTGRAGGFASLVGAEHVSEAEADRQRYSEDVTENPPGRPDLIVSPGSAAEVVAVVRQAAADGLALTPIVAGYNVGGLAIPQQGGIVLDLTRLDRIEVIDEDAMYAVIEPGVTFRQLKDTLAERTPDLVYAYPFAPPSTSVLANALMDGLNSLSMRHGSMGLWLNGLEVVLADGTVARTGAGAVSTSWFSRGPVPDHPAACPC